MTLDEIVKHPKINVLSIRPKHGTGLIVAEAFWDGTIAIITGAGPTAEDAIRALAAEIRARTGAAPALPELPRATLPELPRATLPTLPTLPEIPQ